jgi:hypothetical protein
MKKVKKATRLSQGTEWALLSEEERKRLGISKRDIQLMDRDNEAIEKLKGEELTIRKKNL